MIDLKELLGESYKEEMTLAEIEEALKDVEMPNDAELADRNKRLKIALDKAMSERAAYKKQLANHQTVDEQAKLEAEEEKAKLQEEYDALLKQVKVSETTNKLLGIGYSEKLAKETASAMMDGNLDLVIANQKKAMETLEQTIKENNLKGTPRPDGKEPEGKPQVTKEQFANMDYDSRLKLFNENRELYDAYTKGE